MYDRQFFASLDARLVNYFKKLFMRQSGHSVSKFKVLICV